MSLFFERVPPFRAAESRTGALQVGSINMLKKPLSRARVPIFDPGKSTKPLFLMEIKVSYSFPACYSGSHPGIGDIPLVEEKDSHSGFPLLIPPEKSEIFENL